MKRYIIALSIIVCSLLPLFVAAPASAATDLFKGNVQNSNGINQSVCQQPGANTSAVCQTTGINPLSGSGGLLGKATRIISIIAGMAAIILIVVGGFMYVTAGGDSGKISTARNTIVGAVVGLVIIMLAQVIVLFVASKI